MTELIKNLDRQAIEEAKIYLNSEARLISVLQDIDKQKVYFQFKYTSLFDYCVRRLKLSEAVTKNLTCVARKSVEVPALKKAIERGELTVSKARKICPVLTKENQNAWLDIAKTKSSREIEKAVATEMPELLIPETVKYKAEDRIELKLGVSEKLLKKLERVRDLESQRTSKAASFEKVMEQMADIYLEKNDPIEKAKRAQARSEKKAKMPIKNDAEELFQKWTDRNSKVLKSAIAVFDVKATGRKLEQQGFSLGVPGHRGSRTQLPSAVKHAVVMRDLRKCTHKHEDGRRCDSKRWLDVHHIVPKALGGDDSPGNLTTLCSAHHRITHLAVRLAEREQHQH